MYVTASESYNDLLKTYFDEYYDLSDAGRKKMEHKYKPKSLFLKACNYDLCLENEKSTDKKDLNDKNESVDLSDMPPMEGDEEEIKEK